MGQRDDAHVAALHHPAYDFNDAVMPIGIAWFAELARTQLPAG